ncbi:hypothetical protein QNJ95_44175 [Bradyrhizobium elkanii]|uniref:hypothetical protein n=1 Tax=Bradyrhizobium elkanii TaxID=29448 RepID=UPI002711E11C|nr:hypothetical protein [Bradyrhizobium elkanii]WLA39753.1 hypothetical protein QNJ95_44175 [Bradyrhizobium elkanii]
MAVMKPFKRTARPDADGKYHGYGHYVRHPQYATESVHYVRAFQVLQKDLLELFDYVEPADKNRDCYSYRIHELHTRACIEVEANCKAILSENNYPQGSGNWNMKDYCKLDPTHHLSSFQVRLPIWKGRSNPRTPFAAWKTGGSLAWYHAYNSAKHSRHEKFDQSNFGNMLDAMCGLVAILASQFVAIDFGPEGYVADSSLVAGYEMAIGGYFEIKFPDDWSPQDQYSFDWQQISAGGADPFQTLTFAP